MMRSPTRWLATLTVLSGLLTGLPSRVDGQTRRPPADQVPPQSPTTDMPNLVGLSLQAAQQQPIVVKFRLALVPENDDSTGRPAGTVTRQSVPAGQAVRAGSRVIVGVAVGGVAVPSVEGQPLEIARAELRKLGFRFEVSQIPANRPPPGIVSHQDPRAGTVLPRGSMVRLQVAAALPADPRGAAGRGDDVGPSVEGPTVPDLLNLDEREAMARLSKSRLQGRVRGSPTRGKPGIVIEQTPRPGTRVALNSVVEITVSMPLPVDPLPPPQRPDPRVEQPPEPVAVPNLIGLQPDQAGPVLSKLGLRGRPQYQGSSRETPGAVIVEQDPSPGTRVRRGAFVDLVIAPPQRQPQPPSKRPQLMPTLIGQGLDQATADLTVRQLRLRLDPRDDPMANGPPGVIVRQSVAANVPVEPGSMVTVWVTTGIAVPTLVGLTAEAARQQLASLGLQARGREVVRDRDPGIVVEQTPAARVMVPRESVVGFSVAVLETVRVPDVGGRNRDDAMKLLTASRLNGAFSSDENSTLTPGLATGQDPPPGTEVPVDATVRVRVASGVRVRR